MFGDEVTRSNFPRLCFRESCNRAIGLRLIINIATPQGYAAGHFRDGCLHIWQLQDCIGISRDKCCDGARTPKARHRRSNENKVGAHRIDAIQNGVLRPCADCKHGDNRTNTDDNAKQCQDRAENIGAQRTHRHFDRFRNIGDMSSAALGHLLQRFRRISIRHFTLGGVGQDLTIADFNQAVSPFRNFARMGDDDDRMTLLMHGTQKRHDVFTALAIERAGRFIGENDASAIHQGARNRDALLLATRKLIGPMVQPVPQFQRSQKLGCAFVAFCSRHTRIDSRNLDIFLRGRCCYQIVALEDEAERAAA